MQCDIKKYNIIFTRYDEYIIIHIIFTIYHIIYKALCFGHQETNFEELRHAIHGHLFKITKCFAYYICSYICLSNTFLEAFCAHISKVK